MSSNVTVIDPSPNWRGVDLSPIFSPFYWGSVFSLVLYGITLVQAYMYFPSTDRLFLQIFAAFLLVFDTISAALISVGFFEYTVPHAGSLLPLMHLSPTLAADCLVGMVAIFMSQCYFSWQIFNVMPTRRVKYAVSGIVLGLAILSLAGSIACVYVMFTDNEHILLVRSLSFSITAGLAKGIAALCDVAATIALCYSLGSARTGMKQTDSMIKSVIGYIVQRGLLVTFIQSFTLIVLLAKPHSLDWLPLHVNVTRLYVNTFFAMQSSRRKLKNTIRNTAQVGPTGSSNYLSFDGIAANGMHTFPNKINMFSAGNLEDAEEGVTSVHVEKSVVVANM